MLETFTPAVCGSRKRQIVAQVLFAVTAVGTAAGLGFVLGLAGAGLGARQALLAAAALALVGAAREAGILRFPLPQSRRQVPERWRFERPLPVWASGYGAGLGAGLFTFQPVSTFWVACAGALALARPLPAAICLSLYGAGRATMVVWPRRRAGDPTAAVERLVARRGALAPANVVALLAVAALLGLAPTANGATLVVRSAIDPSVSGSTVAFARQAGGVVVRPSSGPNAVFPDASQPALSGEYLALVDGQGILVLRWRDGTEVARVAGTNVSRPALHWPNLAFVRRKDGVKRIVVRNLVNGERKRPVKVGSSVDLGRPSLRNGRLAWQTVTRSGSRIFVQHLATRHRRVVAHTKIGRLSAPALFRKKLIWVDARSGVTSLRRGKLGSNWRRNLARIEGRARSYWTTSLSRTTAYMTHWTLASGAAAIYKTGA
jgi:hypothetical protein